MDFANDIKVYKLEPKLINGKFATTIHVIT
jgi:hypothetical protein